MSVVQEIFGESGGGNNVPLEPGYYLGGSGYLPQQLSNNIASGIAGWASGLLVNVTDLGYTSVKIAATNSGYIYGAVKINKDGTASKLNGTGEGQGTAMPSQTIDSSTAYIFAFSAPNSGSNVLSMTFS